MAHLNDEDNTVTYADFVSGTIFSLNMWKGNGKRSADTLKPRSSSQVTVRKIIFLMKNLTSGIFVDPYKLWDWDPTAPLKLNHNLDSNYTTSQNP